MGNSRQRGPRSFYGFTFPIYLYKYIERRLVHNEKLKNNTIHRSKNMSSLDSTAPIAHTWIDRAGLSSSTKATVPRLAVLGVVLAMAAGWPCLADDMNSTNDNASSPLAEYFHNWFERASAIQAEQPHWVTPIATVTPRLEQELRYDQIRERLPGGHELYNYGAGKGLELIPADPIELIIGIPAWESEDTKPKKNGWTDETFLLKYRLLSANEDNGNYILTAFMGLSVPTGSEVFSSHHYGFTPTIAGGKGFGDFDVQSTLGVSIPDNGTSPTGAGTPILWNSTLQYHAQKFIWPEVEANYTYWPNGEHNNKTQLFLTPGLVLGRFPIWKRVGITVGAGYQVAVTDKPLMRNNFILSGRIPF